MGNFKVKRRNSKTNVCFVLLIALLLLSLSSCSLLFGNDDDIKRMMDYMSDKYDEEFVLGEIAIRQASNTDILVFPKEHENDWDWEICVRMDHNENDEMSDTYPNMIFRESACYEIEKIADEVFGSSVVVNQMTYNAASTLLPSSVTKDVSVEEFLSHETFECTIVVSAGANNVTEKEGAVQDELVNEFANLLSSKGFSTEFELTFANEETWSELESIDNKEDINALVALCQREGHSSVSADESYIVAFGRFVLSGDNLSGGWWDYH